MSKGNWSFIHEWTIYEYMIHRSEENNLRLKCILSDSKIIRKDLWKKVEILNPIYSTDFPDIKGLKFEKEKDFRPAEIKFTTSLFSYHIDSKYKDKFQDFKKQNGIILVLSHDQLPKNYDEIKDLDIYEIDRSDFTAFCRENFDRLLNRQIKQHAETKVWVMYEGPNFNDSTENIKSARKSNIWCPTENLTSFDLAIGDRILFLKTKGSSSQDVQNNFEKVKDKWILTELVITEVRSKIRSRLEYLQLNNLNPDAQLWVTDPFENGMWRWDRVFEFKIIKTYQSDIIISNFINKSKGFFEAIREVYCFRKSRELKLNEYRDFLENLL
ncbi:MAG TPA: hypothetical protein DHW82_06380 [Spirochaetia bacterium]|nr:MAG: hypothetical protein A2Y41_03350 [Spirochaetes bacterium GWB1_36_13]HCL56620.1 hypothetical protein [Spirochaetia bacterium]